MNQNFKELFLEEEAGQGMVEYALIIAFIALVVIGALRLVGNELVDFFNKANEAISNA